MDVAYDHIQEEALSPEEAAQQQQKNQTLNTEFQQAFKAVSASPWGARLGGFLGQVRKQGESLYSDAQKEYASRSEQAAKGLGELRTSLANTTRNISIDPDADASNTSFLDPTVSLPDSESTSKSTSQSRGKEREASTAAAADAERPGSLPADIVKEATSLVSRFRSEAAKRLRDVQKAEDAADEALLKFGTNLRNYLRDAVTVTAPSEGDGESSQLLFETNDAEGKRVIHSSRFDAQLHVIHSTAQSFTTDPDSPEYPAFAAAFDIDAQTTAIASDLDKYQELRRAMEKLVPENVDYPTFWRRYYFLRKVIQEEEQRRREVLKGAAQEANEEIAWGSDDSEDEEDRATTPNAATTTAPASASTLKSSDAPTTASASASTLKSSDAPTPTTATTTKPKESLAPRPSNEEDGKSTTDSDTSYDIVSGATSRTPGSPKEDKSEAAVKKIQEESDEEDWE